MKRNPVEITDLIKEQYAAYITSEYKVDDPHYEKQIEKELQNISLHQGPFIKVELPFIKAESINDLVAEKVLHKDFQSLHALSPERSLYRHQADAVRKASKGRNLIITTGTGSGKTESFLIPVLDAIIRMKKKSRTPGVKALILYPMNALVNDQIDRIREILRKYPSVTFGKFIGETPDSISEKKRKELNAPKNEKLSREEMRETPPDILITNYSMLEYLLIRPSDSKIINKETLENWRYLVIDEAHMYSGTKATEISYLLRRLEGFAGRKPQYLLTSATLGSQDDVGEIIRFGHDLTNAEYQSQDVIFAARKKLNFKKPAYRIDPPRYSELRKKMMNNQEIRDCFREGTYDSSKTREENLYDLLEKDANIYDLYECAKKTQSFSDVLKKMNGFTKDQLIDLIYLLCIAKKPDGDFLYDIKYHYFLTSPNRAFVTLSKNPKIKFGNYVTIEGDKAFEIARCYNCNHMYIIGKIDKGPDGSRKEYLNSADTIDVYENYEDYDNKDLDIFSLTQEEMDPEMSDYLLCPHCGAIQSAAVNEPVCGCDQNDLIHIYKINRQDDAKNRNNLTCCPHCGQRNNSMGMIRSFRMDQNQATAVISQIYLDAMASTASASHQEKKNVEEEEIDLFGDDFEEDSADDEVVEVEQEGKRQLLSFSDGRQKASYFAVRLQGLHDSILRRSILLNILQENGILPLKSLAIQAERVIQNHSFFEDKSKAQTEAWTGIITDLFLLDGKIGPEALGLYSIEYDLENVRSTVNMDRNKKGIMGTFGLEPDEFVELIRFAILWMRKNRVINYSIAELSRDERNAIFDYGLNEQWICEKLTEGKAKDQFGMVSFLPVRENGQNHISEYMGKVCHSSKSDLAQQMNMLFKMLIKLKVLRPVTDSKESVYQMDASEFKAINGKEQKWYRCDRCKQITTINIQDQCPTHGCSGHLVECRPDKVHAHSFYRNKYQESYQGNLFVREHTAQLDHKLAREYQNLFKQQKINVLSCSTTFEVGVDIGSLENVLLRNVPPTPANYVQRAGRAGRGRDSSALIVTYCLNRSHDYSYFVEPTKMIDAAVRPPIFPRANAKIALRHITATALGFYYRKNPQDYEDNMFIFEKHMKGFVDYLQSRPEDLRKFIEEYLLKDLDLNEFRNYGWLTHLLEADDDNRKIGKLIAFVQESGYLYKNYIQAIQDASDEGNTGLMIELNKGKEKLLRSSTLELLSNGSIIPKYGFPVDVVSLKTTNQDLDLQRDLKIALSEYAPGCEVVADQLKYTSRYINMSKLKGLETRYYHTCEECKATTTQLVPFSEGDVCENCGTPIPAYGLSYVIPSYGFKADGRPKKSQQKPKKTYAGSIRYVYDDQLAPNEPISYRDLVEITLIKGGKLAVINENGFYYCPQCGYTERNNRYKTHYYYEKEHHDSFGRKCSNKRLNRTSLGYTYKTDVVKLSFACTLCSGKSQKYAELVTTAFALLEGLSHELQIDRNDIDATIVYNNRGIPDLLLFDTAVGGGGYVERLTDPKVFERVLRGALSIVSQECCDEDTTCNSCLRNYNNQNFHKIMQKKLARDLLRMILAESEV